MAYRRVVNLTKQTVLAERAELADTPLKRTKGLLGRNGLKDGEGMIITPCSSIHTFFMRFAIDVVFLGKDNKVVSMAESLSPSRIFGALNKARLVLELPTKTIAKTRTSIGDQVEFREI